MAWATFLHADAGRRAHVEIVFGRPDPDHLRVTMVVVDPWGKRTELFSDTVPLARTSTEHPLVLDWI